MSIEKLVKIERIAASDENSDTVLEKRIFENFQGPFYDDRIYLDDWYLWSNKAPKIKAEDLNLS